MTVSRRTILQIAIAAGCMVLIASGLGYWLVHRTAERRAIDRLSDYATERAEVEQAKLLRVQENLERVRVEILHRFPAETPADYQEQWDRWFEKYPDGAWRSRREFFGGKFATMWLDKDAVLTPEMQTQILRATDLSNELMPAWVASFPSLYFLFPFQSIVGFDPRIPEWVWNTPADFDTNSFPGVLAAGPQNNPSGRMVWDTVIAAPTSSMPYIAVMLPVYLDGKYVATIGHDIHALRMLDDSTRTNLPGVTHSIFRPDGRLVAHRELMPRIFSSRGQLTVEESGDPILRQAFAAAQQEQVGQLSGFHEAGGFYFAIAHLAGPEWFYLTSTPAAEIRQRAWESARWVLWAGLFAFALVLGFAGIASRDAAMRERNQDLERVVEMRTAELRAANRDLEQAREDAEGALASERELNALKSNFVSLVSHEFRTPLGIILSSSEILNLYFAALDEPERREHLDAIKSAVLRMSALMEEVLFFSRVEAGKLECVAGALDLAQLCAHLRDEACSATSGRCPIEWQAENDLAGARGDEDLVRHIISNLLSNAVKYSAEGSVVHFSVRREGGDALFQVVDRGLGIPANAMPQLFTAFYRGSNVSGRSGTGLGLSIVKKCVDLHGGEIALESTEAVGTTARVRLPLFSNGHAERAFLATDGHG